MTVPVPVEPAGRKRSRARKIQNAAGGSAAGLGAVSLAAKLRDEHMKQYPGSFERGIARTRSTAQRAGMSASRAERAARTLTHSHPGFKTLAAGTALAAGAAGADKIDTHLRRAQQKVSKSEVGPGQYKPASQMNSADRAAVRVRTTSGVRGVSGANAPRAYHTRRRVYEGHAAFMGTKRGTNIMDEPTVPSSRHPNVHYGASIPYQHHADLDNKINPALAAKSKHPIVIHHDKPANPAEHSPIIAGAVGAHRTTGGKGHVVLHDAYLDPGANFHHAGGAVHATGAREHEVINHEIVHAQRKISNPRSLFDHTGQVNQRKAIGEEGRADAAGVHGKGLYERQGVVADRRTAAARRSYTRGAAKQSAAVLGEPGMHRDLRNAVRAQGRNESRYHEVHDLVTAARKVKKSAGPLTAALFGVSGRASETGDMANRGIGKGVQSLSNMTYDEVSLVDVPANQHAAVMIAKRHDQGDDMADEYEGSIFDAQGNELDEAGLEDGQIVYGDEGQAFRYSTPELDDELELAGAGVSKGANPLLGLSGRSREVSKRSAGTVDLAAQISKALEQAGGDQNAAVQEIAKSFGAIIEQQQSQLDEVSKAAAHERDLRLTGQYVEVAKSLNLPGTTPEEFGPVLKRLSDVSSDEDLEVIAKVFDSVSGALYEEYGYAGHNEPAYGDISDAEEYAEQRVSKGAGERVSKAAGVEMYYDDNPDAYDEYMRTRSFA